MLYTADEFLFPPRPERAIPQAMLGFYQKRNWCFQTKKNGTCNVITVFPNKTIKCRQRDGRDHKAWAPNMDFMQPFIQLPGKGFYVFAAELLHNKTTHIKNKNYIFDMMVANGEYLLGTTFAQRQAMLHELFKRGTEHYSHWEIDEHVWMARSYASSEAQFKDFYESVITNNEDEGIVIKDPNGKLEFCSKEKSNGGWMVKCRREHENYSF